MKRTYAVILPAATDGGFEWGSERPHELVTIDDDASLEAVMAAVRYRDGLSTGYADVAEVDISLGVTDEWPSAGSSDSWGDDIWLGIADYLSTLRWHELLGTPPEYDIDDDTIEASVACNGADEVARAASYLPDGDPLRARLEAAAERHTAVSPPAE